MGEGGGGGVSLVLHRAKSHWQCLGLGLIGRMNLKSR